MSGKEVRGSPPENYQDILRAPESFPAASSGLKILVHIGGSNTGIFRFQVPVSDNMKPFFFRCHFCTALARTLGGLRPPEIDGEYPQSPARIWNQSQQNISERIMNLNFYHFLGNVPIFSEFSKYFGIFIFSNSGWNRPRPFRLGLGLDC